MGKTLLALEKMKEEKIKKDLTEKKTRLKEEIQKRIKEDEDERNKIEDELARLRKEEVRIVTHLNFDKLTNDVNLIQSFDYVNNPGLELGD